MQYYQRGSSSLLSFIFLILIGLFVLLTFKLAPSYLDDAFVKGSVEKIVSNTDFNSLSRIEAKRRIKKAFIVDGVRGEPVSALKIRRVKDRNVVTVNYEKRIPIFYNITVLLDFQNTFEK